MIITEKDNLDRVHFEMIVENSGALFGINGIAYFLTKMLRKGGSLKNPRTKFLQKLEDNAIKLDVIAGREFISISLSFLSEKQKIALNLLEELLTYPNFTATHS
jgi:predicted Zn-dependent peptidase